MLGNDPSTEMTIGFDAYAANTNPVLYYSTSYINVNNLNSYSSQTPDVTNAQFGMETRFVRLIGLTPGQTYYFVVKDNSSTSEIYNFETIPNTNITDLSIIAGGDSRNNWGVRVVANKIVSKLHAHAFMFDGDFIDKGTDSEWQRWLDDWQFTISSNNRITPLIPARGNHEDSNDEVRHIFDCPADIYYSSKLGGDLIEIYTLNSEIQMSDMTPQTTWLGDQLKSSTSKWKFMQYHKPMRPHVWTKDEGYRPYAYWADLFYQYGVDVVLEGDAHTVKSTWPIIPCSGGFDCDEGFKRDDINGTVYIGEGSYAAPLRDCDDKKSWTRSGGMFHQFKWIFISNDEMQIRTVKYDINTSTNIINELSANNRYSPPSNLEIWNPSTTDLPNEDVLILNKSILNTPACTLTAPIDNQWFYNLDDITISANVTGTAAIDEVSFYVDGIKIGAVDNAPYELVWTPTSDGNHLIWAVAMGVNGVSSTLDFSAINIRNKNNIEHTSMTYTYSDEAFEFSTGEFNYKSNPTRAYITGDAYLLGSGYQDVIVQGLRFESINIPPNAIIESANITFTMDRGRQGVTNANIYGEKSSNGLPFNLENYNISQRLKTDNVVNWNLPYSLVPHEEFESDDLSSIVNELVQLEDWSIESPIVFFVYGDGVETTIVNSNISKDLTFQGKYVNSPILSVKFSIPDCPTPNCDDGDPNTTNDTYDEYCRCNGLLVGCTDNTACNFDPNAVVATNLCEYPNSSCDDGDPNTANDVLDSNCICIGDDSCQSDITHSGILSSGNYEVSNTIKSTATINQTQNVVYDAGASICLDKGFLADSGNGVFLLAKIEGCSQLREGNLIEQVTSIKNYPNPFNGETTIEFDINKQSKVSLFVTDVTGKVIATLLNGSNKEEGVHQFRFEGNHLTQGIYYCTLIANDKATTQKMMLMK